MKNGKWKMKNKEISFIKNSLRFFCVPAFCLLVLTISGFAQMETPPAPSAPRNFALPAPVEKTLPNGLRVIVVQTKNVPITTAQLFVKSGGEVDPQNLSGLADFTASLLTKGTKTRTATQIAQEIEFLGGSIGAGAGWDYSNVSTRVTSDKIDKALAVLSDVIQNPAFSQEEIDRYRDQLLDDLAVQMKQPGAIANYVSSRKIFASGGGADYGHPLGGTPASVGRIKQADIVNFHKNYFSPGNSVLVFTGDIAPQTAFNSAAKYLGNWSKSVGGGNTMASSTAAVANKKTGNSVKEILVIDLPNSGQAAVQFVKTGLARRDPDYFKANVLNSVFGGGYSSRLNQEVRIKRGLSYGAGSSFGMRRNAGIFRITTQTKNESAAEVAELYLQELSRIAAGDLPDAELTPRKSVLTGNFGRNLATTGGLAQIVGELAVYGLPLSEINSYIQNVNSVSPNDVKSFADNRLTPNDGVIVIVGDYKKFSEDLKKRFANTPINVIQADKLNLESNTLQ